MNDTKYIYSYFLISVINFLIIAPFLKILHRVFSLIDGTIFLSKTVKPAKQSDDKLIKETT